MEQRGGRNTDRPELSTPASSDSCPPRQPRSKPLWSNSITIIGGFLAAMAIMLLLTFGLFSLVAPSTNPYVDIVGYLMLPAILVIGLVLMPLGILFKSWRLHRLDPAQKLAFQFPRVNLNDPCSSGSPSTSSLVRSCCFRLWGSARTTVTITPTPRSSVRRRATL